MALFRRQRGSGAASEQAAAIDRFWAWWEAQGRDDQAAMATYVHAIHPGLAHGVFPGRGSVQMLVVSPAGQDDVRAVARRWLRAAPEPDAIWEFSDGRPPEVEPGEAIVEVGGTTLDVRSARAGARMSGTALDLSVHHPAFAKLDPAGRAESAGALLTAVLGEHAAATWLGVVEPAATEPMDAIPLSGVRSVVRDLADRWTAADGSPRHAQLRGSTAGGDLVEGAAQVPLLPVTAPHLDTHMTVQVVYTDRTPSGLPAEATRRLLDDFVHHLDVSTEGAGRVVAHESAAGTCILHVYVDSTTTAAEQLRVAAVGWEQGKVAFSTEADPAWSRVAHLRGSR